MAHVGDIKHFKNTRFAPLKDVHFVFCIRSNKVIDPHVVDVSSGDSLILNVDLRCIASN